MPQTSDALRDWLGGQKKVHLKFSDLWKLLLIRVADRAADMVDEEGHAILRRNNRTYSYDLALVAENDELFVSVSDLQRAGSHFEQHGWATLPRRQPLMVELTRDGMVKAQEFIDEIFEADARPKSRAPAADRFVKLDDNAPAYDTAVARLQNLVEEAAEIRVNDWPEKEGVVESLKSALSMIKTRYVNRQTILSAVSAATAFILLKFADAPIAEAAKRTWDAVKALF